MFKSKRESVQKETAPPPDPVIERISSLWETVYRGLYRAHPKLDTSRLELLLALCDAAGATAIDKSVCRGREADEDGDGHRSGDKARFVLGQPLHRALSTQSSGNRAAAVVQHLRMHRSTSQPLKDAVVEALEAYSKEVESIEELEKILRQRQIGYREITEDDWSGTWEAVSILAKGAGNRLMHYHAKMTVLQLDIDKEAVVNELENEGWVHLRRILYPQAPRKNFLSSYS